MGGDSLSLVCFGFSVFCWEIQRGSLGVYCSVRKVRLQRSPGWEEEAMLMIKVVCDIVWDIETLEGVRI